MVTIGCDGEAHLSFPTTPFTYTWNQAASPRWTKSLWCIIKRHSNDPCADAAQIPGFLEAVALLHVQEDGPWP